MQLQLEMMSSTEEYLSPIVSGYNASYTTTSNRLANVKLRSGERQVCVSLLVPCCYLSSLKLYEKIRQHNDIRFPIRKISTAKDKTFLLVQVITFHPCLNVQFYVPGRPFLLVFR